MYYPSLEEVESRAGEGNYVPIYREVLADLETPVSAFLKVSRKGPSFLLESVEGGQRLARYSFIGTEPLKVLEFSQDGKVDSLKAIENELAKYRVVYLEGLPRFFGGAVGYLSYETVRRFEDLPSPENDELKLPEAMFMLNETLLIFDHVMHKIKILSLVSLQGDIAENYRRATQKIESLALRLKQPLDTSRPRPSALLLKEAIPSNRASFVDGVKKIKEYIAAGEAIQVVLSHRLAKPTRASPFEIYRSLRSINPSPYMYYLDYGDFQIIGASPEILIRVEDGTVMTRPLAGTRPRGKNSEEDLMLEKELRQDEKERAEHIMLVDLGRNDLGRVCQPGSIAISELMEVERYSHVMHMVTHVQGKLKEGSSAFDALRACFPAGTVSGAPKVRAMQIIAEFEQHKRGPYAGACGYFSFSGNMDMAIAIRTIVMKDGVAYVQSGCGIVYDSQPEIEYVETLNKSLALVKAIAEAETAGDGKEA